GMGEVHGGVETWRAPAVRRARKNRWRNTKEALTGRSAMKLAAASSCQSVSYALWKLNRPSGIVNRSWESSSTSARQNSDQYAARLKTAAAPSPGATTGSTIVHNVCARDAPSSRAASNSEAGTASKKFFRTQTVNGTCIAA